jgi:hypothetical protein
VGRRASAAGPPPTPEHDHQPAARAAWSPAPPWR